MQKLILLSLFLFASLANNSFAQNNETNKQKKLRNSQIDRENSQKQIKSLRDNCLLVRLKTKSPVIEALIKAERHEEAKQIEQEQLEVNKKIIENFKLYFDFCPTYFFYSFDSQKVRDNDISNVRFLNDSAQFDSKIEMNYKTFFIAEFAKTEADTATFETGEYLHEGENGLEKRTRVEGGGLYGFEALIFKSAQFYQLRRPFPYYSRTLSSIPGMRRSHRAVIKRANSELHYYLNHL